MEAEQKTILLDEIEISKKDLRLSHTCIELFRRYVSFEWKERNGNLAGELWGNFLMESLNNSFQNQRKLVWRALGQFPNRILKEFFSISVEIGLERILMEFLSKLMEIGLESSWSISQWNP